MPWPAGLRAFRHRDYRLFWSGQLVSLIGTWMQSVGQAWIVLELINVWWPRYPDLPWYQNWGVLLVTVILTVVGFVAYAFAPRHEMSGGGQAQTPAREVTTSTGIRLVAGF